VNDIEGLRRDGRCFTWVDAETVEALFDLSKRYHDVHYDEWYYRDEMPKNRWLVAEWSRFVESLADWTLFVTLTSKKGWYENEARRVWRRFLLAICSWTGEELIPESVWVTETNRFRDGAHIHGLVACPVISVAGIRWLRAYARHYFGLNRIAAYESSRGGAGYIVKYMVKGGDLKFEAGIPQVDEGWNYMMEVKFGD